MHTSLGLRHNHSLISAQHSNDLRAQINTNDHSHLLCYSRPTWHHVTGAIHYMRSTLRVGSITKWVHTCSGGSFTGWFKHASTVVMTTAIVIVLSCTSTTTLHTQEVHIPVISPVSTGGEMKAGLGHKWDTQHDINNMMFTKSWSTQCLNMHRFLATVMIIT